MAVAAGAAGAEIHWLSRTSVVVLAMIVLATLSLWPTVSSLASYWAEVFDYHHGFLVAGLVIAGLLAARRRIDSLPLEPQPIAAAALLVAIAAWLVAYSGRSDLGQQMLLPIVLWLAVLAACGPRVAGVVSTILLFLYFAIPIWEALVPLLQQLTVAVTRASLRAFGISAAINGDIITIPEGTFQVAEGCSGKRYLIIALTLAYLGAAVNHFPARRFAALLAVALGMALLANWLRVLIVIVAGHVTHMQHYLITVEHVSLGWVIFAVLIAAILLVMRRMHPEAEEPAVPFSPAPRPHARALLQAAPAGVILLMPFVFTLRSAPAPTAVQSSIRLPLLVEEWEGPVPADPRWRPHFVGAQSEARAAYFSPQGSVETYVNFYADQRQGRELVYYENTLATPASWVVEEQRLPRLWGIGAGNAPAWMVVSAADGERWVISYVYKVDGRLTASAPFAQVWYGVAALAGRTSAGVFAVAARCGGDCTKARALITSFQAAHAAELLAQIPPLSGAG